MILSYIPSCLLSTFKTEPDEWWISRSALDLFKKTRKIRPQMIVGIGGDNPYHYWIICHRNNYQSNFLFTKIWTWANWETLLKLTEFLFCLFRLSPPWFTIDQSKMQTRIRSHQQKQKPNRNKKNDYKHYEEINSILSFCLLTHKFINRNLFAAAHFCGHSKNKRTLFIRCAIKWLCSK